MNTKDIMLDCPICDKPTSIHDHNCPGCGCPLPSPVPREPNIQVLIPPGVDKEIVAERLADLKQCLEDGYDG